MFTRSVLLTLGVVAACDDSSNDATTPTLGTGTLDASTPDVVTQPPSTCAPVSGTGTTHTSVTASETWTAANGPHVIASSLSIPAGVTITVEPCATVAIAENAGILVEGALVARGLEGQPVTFGPLESGKAWGDIEVRGTTGKLDFSSTNLAGGGNPNGGRPEEYGTIDVRGDQDLATQPVFRANKVTIAGSASTGVVLREGGGFSPDSTGLSITGSASYAVTAWGRATGTIPGGGTFTGNTIDKVRIVGSGGRDDVQEDTTFANLGVPYLVTGPQLTVRGGATPALLTIASGTTVQFAKLSRLYLYGTDTVTNGALVADGVTFTSGEAAPAAGDWVGIVAQGPTDARTRIRNSTIAYAGAASQLNSYGCPSSTQSGENAGAVLIVSASAPASAWITTTRIENSAKDGIVRGWSSGAAVDFGATNTFTSVANCAQTIPKPTCPSAPGCQ